MPIPCDLPAEQAILGAILLDTTGTAIEIVRAKLQGEAFHDRKHARIYSRMAALYDEEEPIDLITLSSRLSDEEELDFIGGMQYLSDLANSVPTAANVDAYVGTVYEKYLLRKGIEAGMAVMRQAASTGDPRIVISGLQTAATKLADLAAPAQEFATMRNVLITVYEQVEDRYSNRDTYRGINGVPSGFPDLDRMTSGFQKSDLIIVAARPSVGKTAFALNIAQNVGVRAKETVAIFSLEMGAGQLVQRMICAEADVDATRMRTGYFEPGDWERMTTAISKLSEANIFIDDSPSITVHEIRAKCRRLKKEKGLGLILIDYLQLIQGRGKAGENRQQEVSEISRTLKQIARELDVPVIALSQLSRAVEQRQEKRPMMSDLRESGSIEQDADIIAFLYRDDYYDRETEKKNIIEINIAKQRNGQTGTVELVFQKNFNKFVNLDRSHSEQPKPKPPQDQQNFKKRDNRRWAN
ncbi:replicative DNA helicase [Paenibacillus mesophilus]|nr:replicative DNA helicase [Paenibacillus mesophilus]TMV49708.1 replicative DNA helicase [Paenibacillus mesophilus]